MNHTDCECPENTEKIRKNLHFVIAEMCELQGSDPMMCIKIKYEAVPIKQIQHTALRKKGFMLSLSHQEF